MENINENIENNQNNAKRKRKNDPLALPKQNLAEIFQASPPKGGKPDKKKKQKAASPESPESEAASYSAEQSILEEGNHGAPEIPVQIIAAKPMQLLAR